MDSSRSTPDKADFSSRKYKSVYCYHCEKEVSKSTWYFHYGKFFDQRTKTWTKCSTSNAEDEASADFDFGSDTDDAADLNEEEANFDSIIELVSNINIMSPSLRLQAMQLWRGGGGGGGEIVAYMYV